MAVRKVPVLVLRRFRDKETGEVHEPGEVLKLTKKRIGEIEAAHEGLIKPEAGE